MEREASRFSEQQKKPLLAFTPEELGPVFEQGPKICVACMDDGIDIPEGMKGDRNAGSYIMAGEDRATLVSKLRKRGVSEITAHANCGAAGIAYRRDHPNEHDVSQETIDRYAATWSKELAADVGAEYRFISPEKMSRPPELHDASAIYVGDIKPLKNRELPKGFVVSTESAAVADILNDIRLAVDIASGSHGLGEFTADNPLKIIAVGELDRTTQEQLEKYIAAQEGRVELSLLPVPEQEAELAGV